MLTKPETATALAGPAKIKADGVYDIPMEFYHSDCCDGPSISSSGLRKINLECPAEYWAFSYLNPERYPEPEREPFSFGRAAHCLLVGGEVFDEHYVVRPDTLDGKAWQGNRTVCKQWLADRKAEGLIVLTKEEIGHIREMARVMEKHPIAPTLLSGRIEKSLIWRDPETGIYLKARPDVIPDYDSTVNDYKTTTSIIRPWEIGRDIARYGYYMQLALIEEGLERLEDRRNLNMVLTFQMKKPPYHVVPYEVSPEYLEIGRRFIHKALRTMARCLDSGVWPGYVEDGGIPVAHPPEWLVKQADQETAG